MGIEIVKVQRPLSPPDGPWLIYDRAEKHVDHVDARTIPKHIRDAMGCDHKAFFKGAWSSVVGWGLSQRVKEQGW